MKKAISNHITKNGHNIILAIAAILFMAVLFYAAFFIDNKEVKAGSQHNMSGWAWSADNDSNNDGVFDDEDREIGGVGWISFNCTDTDSCINVDYGVNVALDGILSGYAWYGWEDSDGSTVGGWISFNQSELSGCPDGNCKAELVGGTNLQGWARALSYGDEWDDDDEWDGWIALDDKDTGDAVNYGVTLNGNNFEGFAWDASDISGDQIGIGWIDFNPSSCDSCGVILTPSNISVVLSANPATVSSGENSTLTWSSSNATACTGTVGPAGWLDGGNPKGLSGEEVVGPHIINTVYRLTCTNAISQRSADTTVFVSAPSYQCSDVEDNDADERIDIGDPGCYSPYPECVYDPTDNNESDSLPQCSNCIDDDGDGLVDYEDDGTGDPGCSSADDNREFSLNFREF